jgi:hypothetical protein
MVHHHAVSTHLDAAQITLSADHGSPAHAIHTRSNGKGDCHKSHSKGQEGGCKCCDTNAKCTHDSCACLKCFSVLADVRPVSYTGAALAALPGPATLDKPPGSVRQPPAPPPQS